MAVNYETVASWGGELEAPTGLQGCRVAIPKRKLARKHAYQAD